MESPTAVGLMGKNRFRSFVADMKTDFPTMEAFIEQKRKIENKQNLLKAHN